MMSAEFWKSYYILKRNNPKLAREYLYLARRRASIDRMQLKWVGRAQAFEEEIQVESFKIDLDSWGIENEDE